LIPVDRDLLLLGRADGIVHAKTTLSRAPVLVPKNCNLENHNALGRKVDTVVVN